MKKYNYFLYLFLSSSQLFCMNESKIAVSVYETAYERGIGHKKIAQKLLRRCSSDKGMALDVVDFGTFKQYKIVAQLAKQPIDLIALENGKIVVQDDDFKKTPSPKDTSASDEAESDESDGSNSVSPDSSVHKVELIKP